MGAVDPIKILAVEDELHAGQRLKEVLENRLNSHVVPVTELDEALRLLTSDGFDLVTLDCSSCVSLLDELAELGSIPPVVMIVRRGAEVAAAGALRAGATAFVVQDAGWEDHLAGTITDTIASRALSKAEDMLTREFAFVETALEESSEFFIAFSNDSHAIRWNRSLAEITGYSDEELADLDLAHFFHPDDAQRLENRVGELKDRRIVRMPLRIKTSAGGLVPCDFQLGAIHDATGKIVCLYGWANKAPAPEGALAELTGEIIMRTDSRGRIAFLNDNASDFVGIEKRELYGSQVADLVHPDDADNFLGCCTRALAERAMMTCTVRLHAPRGWRYVELNVTPISSERGDHRGFQLTGRDVTDRKRAADKMLSMNQELEVFSHTVSHDLKGPLATMYMAAETLREMLRDKPLAPASTTSLDEVARMISEGAACASERVEDLLRLAESGQAPDAVEPVDVSDTLNRVVADNQAQVAVDGARIEYRRDLGRILANRTQLYQIFSNLVTNALRYATVEKPVVTVRVLRSWPGGKTYLVRDNGPGIPPGELEEIFKPFYKGESGGTGIGLALVQKLVRTYSGTIRAYNDDGACFEFSLNDYEPE